MARRGFIKSTLFGGYDKEDTDKLVDFLYGQLYEIKNDLNTAKAVIGNYEKGLSSDKTYEAVLSGERKKLTELQMSCDSLMFKNKELRALAKTSDEELTTLRKQVESLTNELSEAKAVAAVTEKGESAALSTVFIEAQQSCRKLVGDAAEKADKLKKDSERLAAEVIDSANSSAAEIIARAEAESVRLKDEALSESKAIKISSENMRAVMLEDVKSLTADIAKLREVIVSLETSSLSTIDNSTKLLNETENELVKGGVPVFQCPESIEPPKNEPEPIEDEAAKEINEKLAVLISMAEELNNAGQPALN